VEVPGRNANLINTGKLGEAKMKLSAKTWGILPFAMLIIFGALLTFNLEAKSREITSDQDLMAAMRITPVVQKVEAPDFVLQNLQGNSVRLSDLRGKVVLVNFWTTW
jgi:cytochrome oxidase Cu insertion factor (SCO1/SenC/PrrC family)